MKKRNKKYNRVEAQRRNNESALKDFMVMYFTGGAPREIDLLSPQGEKITPSLRVADAIQNYRYKWNIHLCVGCYNSKNEKELKSELIIPSSYYLQSEMVDFLNKEHQEMIGELKSKNVKVAWAGWVAKAYGSDIEPQRLHELFDQQEAWA